MILKKSNSEAYTLYGRLKEIQAYPVPASLKSNIISGNFARTNFITIAEDGLHSKRKEFTEIYKHPQLLFNVYWKDDAKFYLDGLNQHN